MEVQKEQRAVSGKPLKEKTSKAERRALQEAQRAAKAAAKGEYFLLADDSQMLLPSIAALRSRLANYVGDIVSLMIRIIK